MEQDNLLNLFTESERLLTQYQRLYHLAVHLCGVLDIEALMKEITNGLMESFDATYAHMYVFDDDDTHAYPTAGDYAKNILKEKYGPKLQSFREIVMPETFRGEGCQFIIVPITEPESKQPLAVLTLVVEDDRLDFETTQKKLSTFSQIVAPATRRALIEEERKRVSKRAAEAEKFGGLIGESQPMQMVKEQILQVAQKDETVLIQGETGTGKELVARAVYQNSNRKGKPFVAFNCSAIPETLIESELFGSEPGAYTGATDRKGLFEQANGGTIFLDEIGEMPPAQQVKLLRVLQEKEIQRLGAEKITKVDVRVIVAANKDLSHLVNMGAFRTDLYYRLNVFPIKLPRLCERDKDILHLANHFLGENTGRYFNEEAKKALIQYTWPGNVRELENAVTRAIAVSTNEITPEHLPIEVTQPQKVSPTPIEALKSSDMEIEGIVRQLVHAIARATHQNVRPTKAEDTLEELWINENFATAVSSCNLNDARDELDKFLIKKVWNDCGQNQNAASRILGISRKQLMNRIKSWGIA